MRFGQRQGIGTKALHLPYWGKCIAFPVEPGKKPFRRVVERAKKICLSAGVKQFSSIFSGG